MMHLLAACWSLVAVAAAQPEESVFCVDVDASTDVAVEDLVRALQPRLSSPAIVVMPCARAPADAIRWRLTVLPQRSSDLLLRLEGVGLADVRPVERRELDRQRLTQVVALVAAEAVLPQLELTTLMPAKTSATSSRDIVAELEQAAPPTTQSTRSRWEVTATPALLATPSRVAPAARLGLAVGLDRLGVGVDVQAQALESVEVLGGRVRGWVGDLRVTGSWKWREVAVRAGLQMRATRVAHRRVSAAADSRWDTLWTSGLVVGGDVRMWELGAVTLAFASDLSLWPHPATVVVAGTPAQALPYVELTAGPTVRYTFGPNAL